MSEHPQDASRLPGLDADESRLVRELIALGPRIPHAVVEAILAAAPPAGDRPADEDVVAKVLARVSDERIVGLGEHIAKLVRDTTGWTSHIAAAIRSGIGATLRARR